MVIHFKRLLSLLVLFLCPLITAGQSLRAADSLFSRGRDFDRQGNMREAEFYYGEAYALYRQHQDTASWLEAGKEYASAMVYRSRYAGAMELYEMLLKTPHPANDAYNRGDIYNSMGWATRRNGNIDQALTYYRQSLPLAQESDDPVLIGVLYDNMGAIYSRKGDYSESLELRQKALEYFQELDNRRRIAITLNNIGHIYRLLSLYDKALEYFNRSLQIRSEIGNVNMLATIYDNIAGVQRNLGNYDQALISYQKCRKYRKQAGDLKGTANTLHNIGLLYKKLGEYDKALDYYRQSLAVAEAKPGPASAAVTMRNMGMIFWDRGKLEEAAELYLKALELRKKSGNAYDIASSLSDMIRMELEDENFEAAERYAAELKSIADSTDSYDLHKDANLRLGEIANKRENYHEALPFLKKAYEYSRGLPARTQLLPLKSMARVFHELNSDSAVVYGQKAIEIIEHHRSRAGAASALRAGYFERHSDFYIDLASWLLTYHQDRSGAYRMIELAKARSLSDELAEASLNIEQNLPEKIRIEQNEKRNRISGLYTALESGANPQKQDSLKGKIRNAELALAAFQNRIRREFPEFRQLESPGPISLKRAQALNDHDTAVLEYAVSNNHLIMFFISREQVRVKQFSRSKKHNGSLEGEITGWVTGLKDAILSNAPKPVLGDQSGRLFDVLIRPFENEIAGYENLVIVPDGALAYLPFEVLLNNGEYLIENHRIKYEPSLTSLTLLKKPEQLNRLQLLAVAGSQFEHSEQGNLRRALLSPLPSTLIEVDSIASHFQQVSTLKADGVSEQALKELLRQNKYKYIHLATHGIIDEEQPGRSGLALSAEGGVSASSTEDGMLRSSEIFSLDLPSDMVVLSACNTGLGKAVDGEGILGLQRSFFYAGTSTVVVSLWNVYDRSTANFMNTFYKVLAEEQEQEYPGWIDRFLHWIGWDETIAFGPRASAMHAAKLQMIEHPLFNHPLYWAPFITVGR